MKIELLVVGKTNEKYLIEAISEYQNRLKHYIGFELTVIQDVKNAKNLDIEQLKEREADEILKYIQPTNYLVLLDEHGKEFTSMQFASYLDKKMGTGIKKMQFLIGGAYGFSQRIYNLANEKMSLSKMTFSHQMVRLFFTEQLYRAMTILNGQPYHHE